MHNLQVTEYNTMLDMAYKAMENAYVPYSGFRVGACLQASSGQYFTGCNIENASFSPTVCAERTAIFKAISEGERDFSGIAIVCSGTNYAYPCGVCRQVMNEFCHSSMPVICGNNKREHVALTLYDLLPYAFGPKDLI